MTTLPPQGFAIVFFNCSFCSGKVGSWFSVKIGTRLAAVGHSCCRASLPSINSLVYCVIDNGPQKSMASER